MQTVHFILQIRDGVGKSLVSSYLMQYLQEKRERPKGIDDEPNFDKLIKRLLEHPERTFVVENGATSSLSLINYLVENKIMKKLKGKFNTVIHIPITGGEAQDDTLDGVRYIIERFREDGVSFNIWVNEFFGKVEKDNRSFEAMEIYQEYKKSIHGMVTLPELNAHTYGVAIRKMHQAKQRFEEVITDRDYTLLEKQRLIGYKNRIFDSISLIVRT